MCAGSAGLGFSFLTSVMVTRLLGLFAALVAADYLTAHRGLSECLSAGEDSEYHQWYQSRAKEEVREEMKWVWSMYREKAMGADSILPEEGMPYDDWGGFSLFLVESLDTLHLMGFHDWFKEAAKYTQKRAYYRRNVNVNVMEMTIRLLGGLVSAYEREPNAALLRRCVELGDRLALAFGMRGVLPYTDLNFATGEAQALRNLTGLSEMGTLSLEFRKLSQLSGNQTYAKLVETVEHFLLVKLYEGGGLLKYEYDPYENEFVGRKCVGAREDSYYEYLYKVWLSTGKEKDIYHKMYKFSKDAILNTLLEVSTAGDMYLKEIQDNGDDANILEHLACFYPGLLALENIIEGYNQTQEKIAMGLTRTCISLYEKSLKHLAPDLVAFPNNYKLLMPKEYASYHLRPETVESIFYLYRLTKDQTLMDSAYSIFSALKRYAKAEFGYSALRNVNVNSEDASPFLNSQPSYFPAETLKYLFLTFGEEELLRLDREVITTEGHVLRMERS